MTVNGVEWYYEGNRTVVKNHNSYGVYVTPIMSESTQYDEFHLSGGSHTYVNGKVASLNIRT